MRNLLFLVWALCLVACSGDEGQPLPPDAGVGAVVINEVNTSAKYIELYNPTDYDCDLSGMRIRKNNEGFLLSADKTADFVIAAGTTLPAHGFAVVGCKGREPASLGLKLGVSGTGISGSKSLLLELVDGTGKRLDYFVNSAFENPRAVDAWDDAVEHTFDVAARMGDGESWQVVTTPTPGRSNSVASIKAPFVHTEVDFEATEPNQHPEEPTDPEQPTDPENPTVADGLAYIFDIAALPEIHVKVSLSEWNRLLACYDQDQNTEEYIHCDATFTKAGVTHAISDAGLRLRGNTSRRRPEGNGSEQHKADQTDWHHVHFMLNLRKFVKDDAHMIGGVRKIHLK